MPSPQLSLSSLKGQYIQFHLDTTLGYSSSLTSPVVLKHFFIKLFKDSLALVILIFPLAGVNVCTRYA